MLLYLYCSNDRFCNYLFYVLCIATQCEALGDSKPSWAYSSGEKDAKQSISIKVQYKNVNELHKGAGLVQLELEAGSRSQCPASCTDSKGTRHRCGFQLIRPLGAKAWLAASGANGDSGLLRMWDPVEGN